MGHVKQDSMPVIRELSAFDRHSGNLLERLVFNHRALFMLAMTLALVLAARGGWVFCPSLPLKFAALSCRLELPF